jgi:hypothetical protein
MYRKPATLCAITHLSADDATRLWEELDYFGLLPSAAHPHLAVPTLLPAAVFAAQGKQQRREFERLLDQYVPHARCTHTLRYSTCTLPPLAPPTAEPLALTL